MSVRARPDEVVTTGVGRPLLLFDAAAGRARRDRAYLYRARSGVALDADGTLVAFAWLAGTRRSLDMASRALVTNVRGGEAEGDAIAVALRPDGRLLAVGGYARLIQVWDVRAGKLVHEPISGVPARCAPVQPRWPRPRRLRL